MGSAGQFFVLCGIDRDLSVVFSWGVGQSVYISGVCEGVARR